MHLLWHRMRRKPEHQDDATKAKYISLIPTEYGDRLNEARHAMEHGVLYYSRPALEAYLDYAETTKQRQIRDEPLPPGLSVEQIAGIKRDKRAYERGVLLIGEARKLGATGDRIIYPLLSNAYVMRSLFDVTADFLDIRAVADHPLEECPNPPR